MNENKEKKVRYYKELKGFRRAVPIVLFALALFITICFITGGSGTLGHGIRSLLLSLFSVGGYAIPAFMFIHAFFYAEDVAKKRTLSRLLFTLIAILFISTIDYTVAHIGKEFVFDPKGFYETKSCGGMIGSTIAFGLVKTLGTVGVFILAAAILAIYITFFFAGNKTAFGRAVFHVLGLLAGLLALIERGVKRLFSSAKNAKKNKRIKENEKKNREFLDDQFFTVDNGISGLKVTELASPEEEIPEEDAAEEEPIETFSAQDGKKSINLDYGLDGEFGSIFNEKAYSAEPSDETLTSQKSKIDSSYGLDESAANVFTESFDPFDFATNEKIASKPSTKSVRDEGVGISEMARPLSSMTNEEIAEHRRRMDFERRKQQILEMRSRGASPVTTHRSDSEGTEEGALHSAKTIEFNVNNETKSFDRTPRESQGFRMTFEKQDYRENDAHQAAAHVAEIVGMNNPAYKRSANEVYTYVKVTEKQEAQKPQSSYTESFPPYQSDVAKAGSFYAEAPAYKPQRDAFDTAAVKDEPYAYEKTVYETRSVESIHNGLEGEFIFNEQKIGSETDVPNYSYERASAESFNGYTENSPRINEKVADTPVREEKIFEQFAPFEPSVAQKEECPPIMEEDGLRLERSMLSPTPETYSDIREPALGSLDSEREEQISERDKKYTFLSEDMPTADKAQSEKDEEKYELSFSFEEEPTVKSSDSVKEQPEEDATTFSFGDEEDEDDEMLSQNDFSELPEEDAIVSEEIPPEEQNPEVLRQRAMFPFLDNETPDGEEDSEQTANPFTNEESDISDFQDTDEEIPDVDEDDAPPFDVEPEDIKPVSAVVPAQEAKKSEKEETKKPDYSNYVFPSIELLGKDIKNDNIDVDEEIQENADKLIETLASFNVTASIKGVDRGPRITRYEVVPARGVKVSSVMNLQDDIALGLAAEGIRMEAPIPGKSAIGVEIPNIHEETVRLRELLETEDFINAKSKTTICIGKDVTGQPVINDIAKMPHLLIAGATGMGKSVCINSLMISMLYKAKPDEVKFIMIDPKQVEFTMYNGIPHLLVPVVSDAKQAAGALMWAVEEMERRYNLLNTQYVRNVDAYNEKVKEDPSIGEPISRIVIVIDEFADLMLQVRDPVENLVMRIAQKARAAGIHLIIGTQRPAVNVITGTIKANVPSRISCKVASNTDSRTVLDAGGAEKLLNKGDMLFSFAGAIKPLRVQGAFVKDSEVEAIMKYLKQYSDGQSYDKSVMEEIERAAQKCSKKSGGADHDDDDDESSGEGYLNDRQFLDAVELAVNSGKIATSLIQRKLSIGYGKAAKFIDIMEDMGIVSESNGSKARDVLISPDEWREKLARSTID